MSELAQLASFGMTEGEVPGARAGQGSGVDYADLYFEYCQSESVSMEEGIVKRATKSIVARGRRARDGR